MHIQIIVGSVREGRVSMPVAQWVLKQAQQRGDFTVELIDLKAWDFPLFSLPDAPAMVSDYKDPLQQRWAEKIASADGFIFVSPEYNHGYPAALKNALDYLYAEWNRKPAAFVTFGADAHGARSIEQLRQVLVELQMAPLKAELSLRDVHSKLNDDKFVSPQDAKRLVGLFDDLTWWTTALRNAREAAK